MEYVRVSREEGIATLELHRGKVNALNDHVVAELRAAFRELATDSDVKVVIFTGRGKFFSFGFDIPQFLDYTKEDFSRYLRDFSDLYTEIFLFSKPVVAALNGHTVAGACMLATACDYRLMIRGKARISLNEITFGSSVLAGSVEMLRFCVGNRNAQSILYTGALLSAEEAMELGLVDMVTTEENLYPDARQIAHDFAAKASRAFQSIKRLVRGPTAEVMKARERDSISEFVDIWYSDETWKQLQEITIRT